MKIIMANDHAAIELKDEIKFWLQEKGYTVHDIGVSEGEKADYPDKGIEAARLFLKGGYDHGIVCCGTGIGISIAANKVHGIRCALPQNAFAAAMAKEHNNCQFIAFGGRIKYQDKPTAMLEAYLEAQYDTGERHRCRVAKIMAAENCSNSENLPL